MRKVFLSYAREDGSEAAARLRAGLTRAGLSVWQDIEDMRGGQAWKEQLRATLREVDAVLVLLTPKAVDSQHVTWEWENALTLQKQVISLMILPCTVPDELARLHYHRLDQPDRYVSGFAALIRDLYGSSHPPTSTPPEAGTSGSTFNVHGAMQSAIGNNPVVINQSGPSTPPEPKQANTPGTSRKKPPRS